MFGVGGGDSHREEIPSLLYMVTALRVFQELLIGQQGTAQFCGQAALIGCVICGQKEEKILRSYFMDAFLKGLTKRIFLGFVKYAFFTF